MKILFRSLLWLLMLSSLVRCDEEEPTAREYPRLKTLPVTDITSLGAVFNAEFTLRGDFEIIRYGFAWDTRENPGITFSDRVIISEDIRSGKFSELIETTLAEERKYYVRAFVETADYLVYGNNVTFESLGSKAPVVISISPQKGTIGDTILVNGLNFSYVNERNRVTFDKKDAFVVEASDTLLKVLVPSSLRKSESEVSASVLQNESISRARFSLTTPEISEVFPLLVSDGDEVIITGQNFAPRNPFNEVKIGNKKAKVTASSKTELTVEVPEGFFGKENRVSVATAGKLAFAEEKLDMLAPEILDIEPDKAAVGELVKIEGANFSLAENGNQVYFDSVRAIVIEASPTSLEVKVPGNISANPTIKVSKYGEESSKSGLFELSLPRLISINRAKATTGKDITLIGDNFSAESSDNRVEIGGISAGIVSSSKTELIVRVPANIKTRAVSISVTTGGYSTDSKPFEYVGGFWKRTGSFPGDFREGSVMSYLGNFIYMGMGKIGDNYLKDFWRFDIATETWTQLNDFPGGARYDAVALVISNRLFVGMGDGSKFSNDCFTDIWEYFPESDSWLRRPDFPGAARSGVSAFAHEDRGFIGLGGCLNVGEYQAFTDLYEFNANTLRWKRVADFPVLNGSGYSSFAIGEKAYVGLGRISFPGRQEYTNAFYSYDMLNDNWEEIAEFPGTERAFSTSFAIGSKGYVGHGRIGDNSNDRRYSDIYEYDPDSNNWVETEDIARVGGYGARSVTVGDQAYVFFMIANRYYVKSDFYVFEPYN